MYQGNEKLYVELEPNSTVIKDLLKQHLQGGLSINLNHQI
jgi:hypothetical protein